MTICRNHQPTDPFARIHKQLLSDPSLSWKAKGILCYAFSKPPSWIFYKNEIMQNASDGERSFDSGIKELEEKGYLHRCAKQDEQGRMEGWEWNWFCIPISSEEFKKSYRNLQNAGIGESPVAARRGPIKNDYTSKNENNNPTPDSQPKDYAGWMPCKNAAPPDGEPVVVFSCLKELDIPDPVKIKLSKEHSEEDLVTAVQRVKRWETRDNDLAALRHVLANPVGWDDSPSKKAVEDAQIAKKANLERVCKQRRSVVEKFREKLESIGVRITDVALHVKTPGGFDLISYVDEYFEQKLNHLTQINRV